MVRPNTAPRGRRRAIATLLTMGCAIAFAAPATAAPAGEDKTGTPAGTGPDKAESEVPASIRERQGPLSAVAGQINAVVDQNETGRPAAEGLDGYLFVRLSLDDNKLMLSWKGDPAESVQSIRSSHPDVDVELHESAYTADDYLDAQDQLLAAARKATAASGASELLGIEHVGDLTGFRVIVFDRERAITESALAQASPLIAQLGLSLDVAHVDEVTETGLVATSGHGSGTPAGT
ncbi:hypothetical protein [Propionicimonas sp.]|uniref:hypothetical protein n=1 Tax=Propionicimonas sp. TaxID=1955623 RepID=UPI0039E545EF